MSAPSLARSSRRRRRRRRRPPEMDEYEAYLAVLADTDVPDFEDPILEWWKVKERKWPALTKMVKQYIAAPASVGGCPASLLRSGQDAWRLAEVG